MKPLYKISLSSINLILECPKCFWLQLVKGEKRPETPLPSLSSGMDKALKEHFDRFMERGELPPELRGQECANDGCKLFDDKEKLKIWRSNFKGIESLNKKSNILLHGAIDNILIKGKKLIVLDYKTRGFPLKEDTHEHYITQMDLYNFLLRENGHETEDYTYLLFYPPKEVTETGEVIFNTDLIKIKTDPKRGEKVFKQAIKVLQGNEPKASKEWRLGNREYDLERKQEYSKKNREILNAKAKLRRQSNPEPERLKNRRYRNKNMEMMRTYGMIQHYRTKQKESRASLLMS